VKRSTIALELGEPVVQSLKTRHALKGVHDSVEIIERRVFAMICKLILTEDIAALNRIVAGDGPKITNRRRRPGDYFGAFAMPAAYV
jgi:hypothetical protein